MKLPPQYVPHLDHRITALMAFTLRNDSRWFDSTPEERKNLGDVYRGSLEGAGIMLRMLMEFLGIKSCKEDPSKLCPSSRQMGDIRLEEDSLKHISAVDPKLIDQPLHSFLARMHDETSKRTAHAGFHKISNGLDPKELRKATEWVVSEIWKRCYDPDPITVHGDLFLLMNGDRWEGIPFQKPRHA